MQTDPMILQRLDDIAGRLDELTARQRASDELFEALTPIAREALSAATARLDAWDRQGVLAFGSELAQVARRIVEGFTPGDVRELGEAVVSILDAVRALTRPEVLQLANDAAAALREASQARPLGAFTALRATRDADVQKGLGLFVQVLRSIGRGARGAGADEAAPQDPKARLAALLGPRRAARLLPTPASPARPSAATARPASTASPPGDRPIDPAAWTREVAAAIAHEQGIALDAARWALIDAARADYGATKASPNIQRLTSVAGVTTKQLYQLFPRAPARTIARIAGLPKPAGCL